jgi:Chromo (CHRromatin Organisation MOdifier) domain
MGTEPVNIKAPAAKDFTALFKKVAKASQKAKESMKLQADKHQSPTLDYKVGQQVWLSTDHLCMLNQPSKKLMEKWIGPYDILRVAPNAVELKLPKSLRIHPVVNVSRVKPYLGSLPGQPVLCPGPVHVTEECDEEYEVEYIVDSRLYKGGLQYLVHWKGYGEEERTWEPASHLANAPELVAAFRKKNPSAPRHLCMSMASFNSLFQKVPTTLCQWDRPPFCHLEYDS